MICSLLLAAALPRIVMTHTMGMMPVAGASGGYATVTGQCASVYGGIRRIAGLGAKGERYAKGYRWDLEEAERQGVDVFGVLLSGNDRSCQFWLGWLETWEKMYAENPNLRIRLGLLYPGDEICQWPENPAKFRYFKTVWDKYRDSKAWYRVDGKLLFMGYRSQMWWDKRANDVGENLKAVGHHRRFFEFLGIGEPFFLYDGSEYALGQIGGARKEPPETLGGIAAAVAEQVDGYSCWGGVIPERIYNVNYPIIADAVRAKGKPWVMPIVNIHSLVGQFYRSLPGVQRLYDTWETAEKTKAGAALLVTWNDWAEATAFAPATSLNYALADLNAKFIHRFKTGAFPEATEDEVFLFYRRYHADADPWPGVRGTVERDADDWGETDDVLDVTVFAKAEGTAFIRGTSEGEAVRPLVKGHNRILLKTAVGMEIAVRIVRDGKTVHEVVSPERVTDRPWREDLIPWGWSSKCRARYDEALGKDFYPASQYSQRYRDGVEDWFRCNWWGTSERVPGSGAEEDPDGDGIVNREECALRTNPLVKNPVYASAADWDTLAEALGPNTGGVRIARQRINLNPYPDRFGNPVHGFLYAGKGGPYAPKWMSKWNGNPKYGIGWQFRSGRRHSYSLGSRGGIAMTLDPLLLGVYRFVVPATGEYEVGFTLEPAAARGCLRVNGVPVDAGTLKLRRQDRLDFVVDGGAKRGAAELVPRIVPKSFR